MEVKLLTNFSDFYDSAFSNTASKIFRRVTTDGMTRPEMFEWLARYGFAVPPHGTVRDLEWQYPKDEVVVYLDEMAHRGEGKVLLPMSQAYKNFPLSFASLRVGSYAESTRLLQIGERRFWLRYTSDDHWRSNVGDVKIEILSQSTGYHPAIRIPLYAIDFVPDMTLRWAVDLNIAPGVKWTGVEDILKPQEVADLITKAIEAFGD